MFAYARRVYVSTRCSSIYVLDEIYVTICKFLPPLDEILMNKVSHVLFIKGDYKSRRVLFNYNGLIRICQPPLPKILKSWYTWQRAFLMLRSLYPQDLRAFMSTLIHTHSTHNTYRFHTDCQRQIKHTFIFKNTFKTFFSSFLVSFYTNFILK